MNVVTINALPTVVQTVVTIFKWMKEEGLICNDIEEAAFTANGTLERLRLVFSPTTMFN